MPYIGNVTTSSNVNGSQINNGTITGDKLSLPFDYDSATLYLDSVNNRVGIGTTTPNQPLEVNGIIRGGSYQFGTSSTTTAEYLGFSNSNGPTLEFWGSASANAGSFLIKTGGSERARLDASGRLLVGTSSAYAAVSGVTPSFQLQGTGENAYASIARWAASTANGGLIFNKSRGASVGTRGVVAASDGLGEIIFAGDDGTNFIAGARIEGLVDGTPGTNDMPGRLVFSTTADGAASPTERLRITSAGLVGIGTSAPGGILDIRDSGTTIPALGAKGTGLNVLRTDGAIGLIIGYQSASGGSYIQSQHTNASAAAYSLLLQPNGGNVGIGTSSPSQVLHVEGNALLNGASKSLQIGSSGAAFLYLSGTSGASEISHSNNALQLITSQTGGITFSTSGATERARIDSSGRLLVGTSSARSNVYYGTNQITPTHQYEFNLNSYNTGISLINYNNTGYAPVLTLGLSQSATQGTNTALSGPGTNLGIINFTGNDGTNFRTGASIIATTDAAVSTGDLPTRLEFSTTADGAASPTERMRLDSTGRLLFGTSSFSGNAGIQLNFNAGNCLQSINHVTGTASGEAYLFFNYNGSSIGNITQNGTTAVAYNTSSDYRLKENIVAVTDGITRLQQLKPSRFNFTAEPDKIVDGFIAHEAQAVVPECVTGTKDAVDDNGNPVYQGIDQSKLVPLLTAALQEAVAEIKALKDRVTALESA